MLARIPEADAVVFATPTYFFGPTAQLKLLLDRMYSLWKFQADGAKCCPAARDRPRTHRHSRGRQA